MADETYEVDPELKIEFIDESLDLLASLDSLFVELEARPSDLDVVGAIFRPVHTIKGNSAFFGLMKVKMLAHEMETLLDLVRNETISATRPVIDALLAGLDMLRSMLERSRRDEPEVLDEKSFAELVEAVKQAPQAAAGDQAELWQRLLGSIEALKSAVEQGTLPNAADLDGVLAAATRLAPDSRGAEQDHLRTEPVDVPRDAEAGGPAPRGAAPAKTDQQAGKTMRVAEAHVDGFLASVGELVVVGEMFRHLQQRLTAEAVSPGLLIEFRRVNESFASLSLKLQRSVMEIRLVPVRTILQKAPRMVRDIAESSGKEVDTIVEGQEIQVDKSLIDLLEPCLTHMVRNAADHGIEPPDRRRAAGKDRKGTVRLAVTETPDDVSLSVSDDGNGINYEAIKAKAVSLGLLRADQKLSEDDIVDILFAPGVSTAAEVTDVSGRGVGMDVVKRSVEELGGRISVTSSPGAGTEFRIQVPKSVHTQIVSGLVVAVGEGRYVLPLHRVSECFDPPEGDRHSVLAEGECVVRHGQCLPVVRLDSVPGFRAQGSRFRVHASAVHRPAARNREPGTGNLGPLEGQPSEKQQAERGIMVAVNAGRKQVAVCVDEVIGVQQVVLKEVNGLQMDSGLFTGGALMGDGRVAMVLDVDTVCANAAGNQRSAS